MFHQYMWLTWLITRSPFDLSFADTGPHCVDCESQIVIVTHNRSGSWSWMLWLQLDCLKYNTSTDILHHSDLRISFFVYIFSTLTHLSIILKTVYFKQCCKYCYFAFVVSYTWHLLHFCPSLQRDPSQVALSGLLFLFLQIWLIDCHEHV